MIEYKIDVTDALKRVNFNTYKAKTTGFLSQDTLKKFKNHDTNVSLKSLNALCVILDMELNDVVRFTMTDEEKKARKKSYNFSKMSLDYLE